MQTSESQEGETRERFLGTSLIRVWPILFGVALTVLRISVLARFGVQKLTTEDLAGLLLGIPGQIGFALLLALPLFLLRRSRFRIVIYALIPGVVFLNIAAFHYEAVFWRLPGISLLYYIRETGHLSSSAEAHAPLIAIFLELLLIVALLVAGAELLIRNGTRLESGRARKWLPISGLLVFSSLLFMLASYLVPSLVPARYLDDSRVPILWAIQSWSFRQESQSSERRLTREEVLDFQRRIGQADPVGGVDPRYPLCGEGPRHPGRTGNGRSVIFLVLESVGIDEMNLIHDGERVMPALRRIAAENLSFDAITATGAKSAQAMPALFAGLPPQPAVNMLWRRPLNHLEGFPLNLRRHGYRTVYLHGGDLSFEQQRPFLRMVGFEEIVEYDITEQQPFVAWGAPDDVMFDKLEDWIGNHRNERGEEPYFATLFTLSTHDPYLLPPEREPVWGEEGPRARFIETLRFLDEQIERLDRWYRTNEESRGTILVITGDHAPHLAGDRRLEDHEVVRFEVPLVMAGRGISTLPSGIESRPGVQFDLPATILGALDLSPGPCDQGVDLLQRECSFCERTRFAVGGDQLEEFHVWFPEAYVHLDQITRSTRVNSTNDERLTPREIDEYERRTLEFRDLSTRISAHLTAHDAFAPPPSTVRITREPVPRVDHPRFIAHRGQSRGELPAERQNKGAAIEQALRDGFEWIELDVQMTRDGVPVLLHDATVADAKGQKREVLSLTLSELRAIPAQSDVLTLQQALEEYGDRAGLLIEVKTPSNLLFEISRLTLRSAALVRNRNGAREVIMDSFSPLIADSLEQHCGCEVGIDAPYMKPVTRGWLRTAALAEMDWIYLHYRQASPELIRDAHQLGLRVLVYTVNELEQMEHLATEWPDAVITDRADLMTAFDARYGF